MKLIIHIILLQICFVVAVDVTSQQDESAFSKTTESVTEEPKFGKLKMSPSIRRSRRTQAMPLLPPTTPTPSFPIKPTFNVTRVIPPPLPTGCYMGDLQENTHVDKFKQNSVMKLQTAVFPSTCVSMTKICQCESIVKFVCGRGTTLVGKPTATCQCIDGRVMWSEKPNCRGCHRVEQDHSQDTRKFNYNNSVCDQHHCECDTNVSVTCEHSGHYLSGSSHMMCRCLGQTDSFWEYSAGSEPRCIEREQITSQPGHEHKSDDKNSDSGGDTLLIAVILGVLALIIIIAVVIVVCVVYKRAKLNASVVRSEPVYATVDENAYSSASEIGSVSITKSLYPRQVSEQSLRYVTVPKGSLAGLHSGDVNPPPAYYTLEDAVQPQRAMPPVAEEWDEKATESDYTVMSSIL